MAILAGEKNVAATATPEALVASTTTASSVIVQAKRTNTDSVYLGGSLGQYFELIPGASVGLEIADLAELYVRAAVAGEGVSYVGAD